MSLVALLVLVACGAEATPTSQPTSTPAPPPVAQNTIAFQDFGWDPGTQGASGSVTYEGVSGSFNATIKVQDLKPSHGYTLYVMDISLPGVTNLDSTTYAFTTDSGGAAGVEVSETFAGHEGAPLPAYQVHFLVVDPAVDLADPLPNPLGINHPIALACSFPLGFLQMDVPGIPDVSLQGDTLPLFNYGWAPGFEGGSGSLDYKPQNGTFDGTIKVEGLKPNFQYRVRIMGAALNGDITSEDFDLNTDAGGAGSLAIIHEFPVPEGVPLPAYQVHFLVIDPSETLAAPLPNPLGVENPIALACLFPLGFLQMN